MSTLLNNFREKTSRAGLVRSAPADRSRRPLCFPVMGLRKSFCYPFTCPRELARPDASQPGRCAIAIQNGDHRSTYLVISPSRPF